MAASIPPSLLSLSIYCVQMCPNEVQVYNWQILYLNVGCLVPVKKTESGGAVNLSCKHLEFCNEEERLLGDSGQHNLANSFINGEMTGCTIMSRS